MRSKVGPVGEKRLFLFEHGVPEKVRFQNISYVKNHFPEMGLLGKLRYFLFEHDMMSMKRAVYRRYRM